MKASLSRTLLAVLMSVTLALPAAAAPAMWRVSDEDSQVWLFGSVHAFDRKVSWRTAAFNKALKAADLVYFEMPTNVRQDEYQAKMFELGVNPKGRTLSSYLNKKQRGQLTEVVSALKLNPEVVEKMRPWFAAMTLAGIAGDTSGRKLRAGVEDTLKREISARKLRGLDTVETQLRVMADLSDRAQVAMLMETISGDSEPIVDLTDAWLAGDVDGLFGPAAAAFGRPGSEMLNALLTKRNKRWAAQIKQLLDGSEDVMVIVGAAHFGGSSGLPTLLKQRGLTVERVQ